MVIKKSDKSLYNKDYFIERYERRWLKGYKPFFHNFWIRYLKKIKSKGKLLDIGCGEGFFLYWAEKYWEIYGVDISEYAISKAKKRLKSSNLTVYDINDGLDFYKDSYFDIITVFDVLAHLENPDFLLSEISRIIKNEGILIISTPNLSSISIGWKKENWCGFRDKTHKPLLSNEEWFHLIRKKQFNIIKCFYGGLWDSPYFKNIPVFLQHLVFKVPATILFGIVKFPQKFGENTYIVARKKFKDSS